MKKAEKTLKKSITESPSHQFVPFVPRPESVTMTEAECLSSYHGDIRLLENPYSKFLEIMEAPDIVVALKEINLDTRVHQINQSREHPHVAFRDDIPVLVPEIPNVSEQIQRPAPLLRNRLQEPDKTSLPVNGIIDLQAKMHIRDKI